MDKKAIAILGLLVLLVIGFGVPSALAGRAGGGQAACNDGIDNDGDGYTDLSDPGCSSRKDTSELNLNVQCDDGNDNDGDGFADYRDAGCSGPTDNDETNCGDGVCEGTETQANCPQDCGYPDSCSDTDGGNNINVQGIASGYFNNNPYSDADYCVDAGNVIEYYCNGNSEASLQQSCGTDEQGENYCQGSTVYRDYTDYLCSGGRCSSITTPQAVESCQHGCTNGTCNPAPDSCSDTDGGNNIYVQGNASGYLNQNFYADSDYCADTGNVMEYYCNGNSEASQQQSCGNDGYGANYCQGPDVYRNYTDNSCDGGRCSSITTPQVVESCQHGCTNGTCNPAPDSCSDTDGGNNINVQGTASGYYNNNPYSDADYCVDAGNVMEYYCNANSEASQQQSCGNDGYGANYCQGSAVYRNYTDYSCSTGRCLSTTTPELVNTCLYGCTNGTCNPIPNSCADSDGGYNPFVQGTASGYLNQNPYNYTDYCSNSTFVIEYSCIGTYPGNFAFNCTQNMTTCVNGACV